MKALKKLEAQLKEIGATLDWEPGDVHAYCDAPRGYAWKATGTPTISLHFGNCQGQTWLAQELKYEMKNLKMGLYKITDPKELEEVRWNNDDDTWGAPEDAPDKIEFPKA
jgi:hypothetical protein